VLCGWRRGKQAVPATPGRTLHPDATPREEAVRRQVQAFKQHIEKLVFSRQKTSAKEVQKTEDMSVAKLYEEIKIQIRDLPELAKCVRQLHAELLPAISTIVQKNQPRYFHTKKPQKVLEIPVGDKNIEIIFATTWLNQLETLGWPNGPKANEFLSEVRASLLENSNKLGEKCKVSTSFGAGYSQPNPKGGLLLNNFSRNMASAS